MIKIVKEELDGTFQNEWNDIINAIHQVNPKTNKGRILKGKLEKMCYSFIKEVNKMNESKEIIENKTTDKINDLAKSLGITKIYTSDEHAPGGNIYWGYANISTKLVGDFTVSFSRKEGLRTDGYPWKFLQDEEEYKLTDKQIDFIRSNKKDLSWLLGNVDYYYGFFELKDEIVESKKTLKESSSYVTFDITDYESAHMKKPRGTGCWFFSTKRRIDDYKANTVVQTPAMPYAEAKKYAIKVFKERGIDPILIYVMG